MKKNYFFKTFFALFITMNVMAQNYSQLWMSIINSNNSVKDELYSKQPLKLNSNESKLTFVSTVGGKPYFCVLNSLNGDLSFSKLESKNAIGFSSEFDSNDNLFTLSADVWNGASPSTNSYLSIYNSTGNNLLNTTINNSTGADYIVDMKMLKNNNAILYGLNGLSGSGLMSSSVSAYNLTGSSQWSSVINELDWYYGYTGSMCLDDSGNIIFTGKRQISQGDQNSYDIVIRKVDASGSKQWQTFYDYNNLQDHLTGGNFPIKTDLNGDVYFTSTNNNALSNNTVRLVKLDGKTGQILFQKQIGLSNGNVEIIHNSSSTVIVSGVDNKIQCFDSKTGDLIWFKSINNVHSATSDINGNVFITTKDKIYISNTSGEIKDSIFVSIPSSSVNLFGLVFNSSNSEFYVYGLSTFNSIDKTFIAKYSSCKTPIATITPQGNTNLCQGEFVDLNTPTTAANYTYEWYNNGQLISDANLNTYQATASGNYSVKVINGECNATSSEIVVNVNSLPIVTMETVNQFILKNADPIQLVANPSGGTFSGEGVQGSMFTPANVTLGKKTFTYNYTSPEGCSGQALTSILVLDSIGNVCNVTTYDTVKVTKTITDTVSILKVKFKLTTGIKANQYTTMNVYPNPTSDVIIIDASDVAALNGYSYKLVDVQGKEVYNALVTNTKTEISMKTFGKAGLYVLHVVDANNVSIETKQIVLE